MQVQRCFAKNLSHSNLIRRSYYDIFEYTIFILLFTVSNNAILCRTKKHGQ